MSIVTRNRVQVEIHWSGCCFKLLFWIRLQSVQSKKKQKYNSSSWIHVLLLQLFLALQQFDPGFITAQPTTGTKWPALKGSADKWLFVTLVGAHNAASYQEKIKCLLDNSLDLLRITLPLSKSSTPSPQPTADSAAEIHHLVSRRLTKCGRQWSAVYRAGQTYWIRNCVPLQRLCSHL